MGELSKQPNIGAVVEEQLNQVGITTLEELKEAGSRQAWLRILAIDSSACIHRLYSLEGAIRGIKKSQLPQDVKDDLKEFYNHVKGSRANKRNNLHVRKTRESASFHWWRSSAICATIGIYNEWRRNRL